MSIQAEKQAEHLRIHDLRISQIFFDITNGHDTKENRDKLLEKIQENNMLNYFEYLNDKGY